MKSSKGNFKHWLRILHRDIGYFVIGITMVYALSGLFLSHSDLFPSVATVVKTVNLPQNLSEEDFSGHWDRHTDRPITHMIPGDEKIDFFIEGGKGVYRISTGEAVYETFRERKFTRFVNQLHRNQKKGWIYIADFYVIALIFLAVSGIFIDRRKNGFMKRGIWLMLAGFVLIIIFIWVN